MKYNGKNIITDQDITLTGNGHQGELLSDVLSSQDDRITDLEGNIKWIYKYGGVGSGAGHGGSGGGSDSSNWKALVSRADNGQILVDGGNINFPDIGDYRLKFQIPKGGGTSTFNVELSYENSHGVQFSNDLYLRYDNQFTGTRALTLDKNGVITIKITNQDTGDFVTYTINYIVSPYKFNLYYVYADDHSRFTPSNNIIFMEEVKDRGLLAALECVVSVGINSSSFSYIDWAGVTHSSSEIEDTIQEKTTTIIYLPLCDDVRAFLSDSANARFYQFSVSIDIILEGNVEKEKIGLLSLGDNLVPKEIYLKVVSDKELYGTSQLVLDDQGNIIQNNYPKDSQYVTGPIAFKVTPYHGSLNPNRKYSLSIYVNGVLAPQANGVILFDQQEKSVSIAISDYGEKVLRFEINEDSTVKSFEYYIYVKETISSFTWYPKDTADRFSPVEQAYFRQYNSYSNITGLSKDSNIHMTVNAKKQEYTFNTSTSISSYNGYDQFLSLGIQFSSINDLEKPICAFRAGNTLEGAIVIYQNKVIVSETNASDPENITGSGCEIFLPPVDKMDQTDMDGFHVISIYKKLEKKEGNNFWKGTYVYIDGVLEGAFGSFTTVHRKYEKVAFFPGNYYVNLVETACIQHQDSTPAKQYMSDHDILGYYYAYDTLILKHTIDPDSSITKLYEAFGEFTYDDENFVIAKESTIRNIAKNSSAPVLLMTFVDDSGKVGNFVGYGQDNFRMWMSEHYEESQGDSLERWPVTISWAGGEEDLNVISLPSSSTPAQFYIKPQGSSTLGYRCKNWELYAPAHEQEGYSYIYSPNFKSVSQDASESAKEEAYKTFLPEESFTLKADIVDSSHTNNNAIGDFVNSITKKFDASTQRSRTYAGYIKNCLTGFPILLFLRTRYKRSAESTATDQGQYYFLGIYNFNLGRNSFFNLGYKDVSVFDNEIVLRPGFNLYSIADDDNSIKDDIVVAEVQGNDRFFDFSQYGTSILFKSETDENDKTYMFGDLVYGALGAPNAKNKIQEFVSKVSDAGGYIFKSIGKSFSNSLEDDEYGYYNPYSAIDGNGVPKNRVPNYKYQATRTFDPLVPYTFERVPDSANEQQSLQELVVGVDLGDGNLQRGIDFNALCEYYTICMAFGLVDSVQKNLNIKTWNASSQVPKFYLAFYDMDTCLGVSNSGSKISYFAFSDYWTSGIDSNGKILPATVYRDYSPKKREGEEDDSSSFYDVPSSFLFAIAKYGYEVLNHPEEFIASVPNNLWGAWRSGVEDPTDKTVGCLSSASKFIENFYKHHLSTIDRSAFNFNYKYKYFAKADTGRGFDTLNFPKFYGRKLYYTEDWLNGRFHILDAYFNVNGISDKLTTNYSAPYTASKYKNMDQSNEDVFVLHDIFSLTQVQYASLDYNVTVTSRPYAPLILDGTNHSSRYIFPDDGQPVLVNLATDGNQYLTIGGSALWTDLSTINPFITKDAKIRVHSKYFTTLLGTSGICNSWDIETPSLRKVSLTNNRNYSGILTLAQDAETNPVGFPNLDEVDVSGTALSLTIDTCPVTIVKANNMVGGDIAIANVSTLQTLEVYGKIKTLTTPAWKRDITFPTNYSSSNTSARLDCGEINITSNFDGATLYITNNADLSKLTAKGFKTITIRNCPKLKEVHIQDTNKLVEINIAGLISGSDDATIFSLGAEEGVVNLSSQVNLTRVYLSNLKMTEVRLPAHNLNLAPGAFYNCQSLTTITGSGTYYITGPETFRDCPNFTFDNSLKLKVAAGVSDISRTFYITTDTYYTKGSIGLSTAEYFLKECCRPESGNSGINYIDGLFFGQNIVYGISEFVTDYAQKTCRLSFENFTACVRYDLVFYNNPVTVWNRFMFSAANTRNTITISNLLGNVSGISTTTLNGYRVIYAPKDYLYEIIENLTSISFVSYNNTSSCLCFIDSAGNVLNEVALKDTYCPIDTSVSQNPRYPRRLTSIDSFEFYPIHRLDFSNIFTSNWTNAASTSGGLSISHWLWYISYSNIVPGSLEELFYNITLRSASLVLRTISYSGEVNMYRFIDWSRIGRVCDNLFYSSGGYESLGFRKRIKAAEFLDIWNYILSAGSQLTGVAYLFSNCSIINWEGDEFKLVSSTNENLVNTSIVNTAALFRNCLFFNVALDKEDEEAPASERTRALSVGKYVTHNFLNPLPNLVNAYYDFKGMKWKNPVPFDFFHKRVRTESTVWVIDESKFNTMPGTNIASILDDHGDLLRYELSSIVGVDGSSSKHKMFFDGTGRAFYTLELALLGTTTTIISNGSTVSEIEGNVSKTSDFSPGDSVVYSGRMFMWIGDSWKDIGLEDELNDGDNVRLYYDTAKRYYINDENIISVIPAGKYVDESDVIVPVNYSSLVPITDPNAEITNLGLYRATMYTYSYTKTMSAIHGCFQDIEIDNSVEIGDIGFNPNGWYNYGSFIRNSITDTNGRSHTNYYTDFTSAFDDSKNLYIRWRIQNTTPKDYPTSPRVLAQGTEITDCENLRGSYTQVCHPKNISVTLENFSNFDKDHLFTAPDILYGIKAGGSIQSLFSNSSNGNDKRFSGMIPDHLIPTEIKSISIRGMLTGLNIVPKFLYSVSVPLSGGEEEIHNVYYFVPKNFTSFSDLRNSFNFRLLIPGDPLDHYYIFLKDSLPASTTSLSDSLPSTDYGRLVGQEASWFPSYQADSGIRYNIMATEKISDGEYDLPDEGLDMSKFPNLKLDYLISNSLAMFLSGPIFKDGTLTSWSRFKYLTNTSDGYMMLAGGGDTWGGISAACRMELPRNNDNFLRAVEGSSITCRVSRDSVTNISEIDTSYYPRVSFI